MKPQEVTAPSWGVGDVILGRYDILSVAMGGMAIVYLVYDRQWKRPYAIKGLRPDLLRNDESRERFHREALLWVNLGRHPYLVTAEMVQMIGGVPFLFLEYVDGGDLASRLGEGRPPLEQSLRWTIQFSLGASYAYSTLGLVHRDIKPANALITASGDLKVTDFGISRSLKMPLSEPDGTPLFETEDSGISGTLAYVAPELVSSPDSTLDIRSDIFSFGCTFYELLSGHVLYPETNLFQAVVTRLLPVCVYGLQGLEGVPPGVLRVLQACLELKPEDRYGSFLDIANDLRRGYREATGRDFELPEPEDEDSANLLHNRGLSLATLGYHREAVEWYGKALQVMPDMPDTEMCMGESLLALGDAAAVSVFREILRRDPSEERARMGLAKGLMAHDDADGALAEFGRLRDSHTYRTPATFMGAALLEAKGHLEEAAAWKATVVDRRSRGPAEALRKLEEQAEDDMSRRDFRVTPVRQAAPRPTVVRRAHFTADGLVVEVRGEEILIPWPAIILVQVGYLKEESVGALASPRNEWYYLMDVHMWGRVLRFDSRHMSFVALLDELLKGSESVNMVRILWRFSQFAARCRLSPSPKEFMEAGPLSIPRYQRMRTFEEHGIRLLRMPRRR